MASINRLKPGQIVWDIKRQKLGNTELSCGRLYEVEIIEVHDKFVIASWNGNKASRYGLSAIAKWRVNKPEPKGEILGHKNYK